MTTDHRLRALVRWVVAALSLVATACGTDEPPRVAPPLRAERPGVPTEAELMSYLEWHRDLKLLTNRNRADTDAVMGRISSRNPSVDAPTIAADPEWRALSQQLVSEMQAHLNRVPKGLTASALQATILGVGRMVIHPTAMVFEPGRDESALSAARAKYGDEFVDWVLAHEDVIVATLGQ